MIGFEHLSKNYFEELYSQKLLPSFYYKSLSYSFFSGGKRVRPQCLFTVGKALGLREKKLFPAALAVELIHTYSLVHDDLPSMDDDTYRRGKLTHHVKYGEASAVLSGDSFLTLAFEVLARAYSGDTLKNLVLELSKSSGLHGMVGGQVLDCLTKDRSTQIFERIHHLKTAKLFEYSLVAPAYVAELNSKDSDSLRVIGKNLGLLFQLQDDLFDEDKKDERLEENILSILSKKELLSLIEEKKDTITESLKVLDFLKNDTDFNDFLNKVFKRNH